MMILMMMQKLKSIRLSTEIYTCIILQTELTKSLS